MTGSVVGLAVGDALGMVLEFSVRDSLPRVTEMRAGGPFKLKRGQWTDDSSCALALADSLLCCDELDQHDYARRLLDWYHTGSYSVNGRCFDIGGTTRSALVGYDQTGKFPTARAHRQKHGNGAIMRLSPAVAFYHSDEQLAVDAAVAQGSVTHASQVSADCCQLLAETLLECYDTGDRPTTGDQVFKSAVVTALAEGWYLRKDRDDVKSTGHCVDTLEAALWAVSQTTSFEDALVLAVNLADDSDTVGAVTGQVAGAIYGLSGIPERWLRHLAQRKKITRVAERLFEARA